MAEVEFENNFDDLINKPSGNTISETLSEMDVSNPFHDVVSPLVASEESSDTEVTDYNILNSHVYKNGDTSLINPLESSQTFSNYEPQASIYSSRLERDFDVDISSVKGIDAASSTSIESHITEKSSGEESLDDETTIRRARNDWRIASLGYKSSQSDGLVPTFKITVEDPQKIGDPIHAHIIYRVRTRTTSTVFRSQDFTVLRRYRDFLWLYNQLTLGNPGVIVPPVPGKHAIGRFQDEFVENRRQALEKCLNKITSHPILYRDPDLKLFLESDTFTIDVKRKNQDESKGVLKSLGEAMSNATTFNKFTETDEWFEGRRNQLDILESQLKTLLKSVEAIVKQRKDLGGATVEFGSSLLSLADAELNKSLADNLTILGNLQQMIRELHEKQARQDVLTLENTIGEYIRIIGSIKVAFNSRTKFYQTWQNSISDLQKKKSNYERSKAQGRFSQDRLTMMLTQIAEAEHRVEDCKNEFEDVSKLIKDELDRFDKEKVEDFKNSVEAFLESMVQTQKEIISLWESYFQQVEAQQSSNLEDSSAIAT
ncbi:Vps5 C terminal like-domain-containing protein [Glomus cerebriforme]|uniref:Vps5 C terminal like-domain-containing protein n=1 Tax=Glomus cerebriforme TaxID=658196 RepID=A0A397SVM8_9GLOM|nr:Vps5 C terminal like-domain-containing protein [Glomus cerebriforme]